MSTFAERLSAASEMNRSLLCVGLDPEPSFGVEANVVELNRILIEATADIACAYKPQMAYYEAMGTAGLDALQQTLDIVREVNPDIPIIGDAKRNDIGDVSMAYAGAVFDSYKFDAVTVNPYMGSDSLAPFFNRQDKGVFVLCRTSNPGGADLQELPVLRDSDSSARPLYEVVAELANEWNVHGNVGLVVGATNAQQIGRIRQICPKTLFLVPGVGRQGGDLQEVVFRAMDASGGGFIINVSRKISYDAKTAQGALRTKKEALKAVRASSRKLRDEINSLVATALEREASRRSTLEEAAAPM